MHQHNNIYQQLADIQQLINKNMSWMSTLETMKNQSWKNNFDAAYTKILNYPSLAELYRIPSFSDSSAFIRQDVEDNIKEDSPIPANSSSRPDSLISAIGTTSDDEIKFANEKFMQFLDCQTKNFLKTLSWTDFEDGIDNDITRLVSEYIEQNRYVTYCWLNKIFNGNRTTPSITSRLLRTLAMVVNETDYEYMLSMVTCGVASQHPEDQEAAIMVIEKWRTKECLEAMQNTTFGSDWIKEYADQVITELKNELGV